MKTIALSFLALCAGIGAASAHIVLERKTATPGASHKAVLAVTHGCEGSPTVTLRVTLPEGFIAAKPMAKPGWAIETVKGPYARSYSYLHGMTIKAGVREIVWRGRLPGDFYDEFTVVGFLADTLTAGETLYFPVIQECEAGRHDWTQVPAPGQDAHALKQPAPALRLEGAAAHQHAH